MNLTKKILLIEDDGEDAEYLCEIVSQENPTGFEIDRVEKLSEAQARLKSDSYDLILADLSLPDSVGMATFLKMQETANNTPILILTGLDDEQIALDTLRRGAQDYIVKGQIRGSSLVKSIHYAIERNKIRQELADAAQRLSQVNQQLNRLAHKDPLTDLLNRRGLEQVLSRESAWAQRHGSSIMVLIIDLDDFKKINDTMGHSTGDAVLKELAVRIQGPLRSTDSAGRIGGDEFLILLPDTEPAEGIRIAEKVRKAISNKAIHTSPQPLNVTASVGVVSLSRGTHSIDDLLSETHHVLYQSKRKGKNRVSYEKKENAEPSESIQNVADEFQKENKFHAFLQPIMNISNNAVNAYEILARSTVSSFENPDDFLRIGLENNFITSMDLQCLSACLQVAKDIPVNYPRHVNIAPATIVELTAPRMVEAFADRMKNETYCIEISQHQIVGDPSYLAPSIQALKKAGLLIAIENVSFGQNSLESIIILEPDLLKIDHQYVNGISQDPARLRSLNRLLKLAENLHMGMIAHGIEQKKDLEVLKSMGIKLGQGFLWGRPAPRTAQVVG